jgi:hypothetical protein
MTIASLVVKLTANAAEFHREMENAARRIERTGKMIARAGREMSVAISLPLIAAGFTAFRAMLEDSRRSFGPLFTAVEALKNEFHNLSLSLGRELQPYFIQFVDLLRRGITILEGWVESFHRLSPTMQKVIIYTLAFLAALGPTLLIVGKLVAAVGAFMKVLGFLLTPTGLLAIAIIALAAAIIYVVTHWEWAKLKLMLAWTAVQETVYDVVRGILSSFTDMIAGAAYVATAMSGMPGIAGAAFGAMSVGLAKAAEGMQALQKRFDVFADQSVAKSAAKILALQKAFDAASTAAGKLATKTTILDGVLKNLEGALLRSYRTAQVMGDTFNLAALHAQDFQAAIKEALDRGVDPSSVGMQNLGRDYRKAAEDARTFTMAVNALGPSLLQQKEAVRQYNQMISIGIAPQIAATALIAEGKIIQDVMSGIADGIEAVAMRIGDLFSGVSSRVRGFFAAIGSVLAGVMKQIGKTLVELGVVAIMYGKLGFAIKFFAKNPLASIAVGVALIALGNQLGAAAERTASAGGDTGGGGGGSVSSSSSAPQQGSTDLILRIETPDGIVDAIFRDPRNADALAKVLEDLSGRRVTTVFKSNE